jgi:CRP-like cAMP-binding protein
MPGQVVKVLDVDPELGELLSPGRFKEAALTVRALRTSIPDGEWAALAWPFEVRAGLGLLVLEGLLIRRIQLGGRFAAELLGPGDVLRPWQEDDEVASVSRTSGWRCLRDCSVAVLDLDFARRIAPFPEIQGQLMARTLRRSRNLAVTIAILNQPKVDLRLLMLLWHMADRWGRLRDGEVLLPTQLPHAVLAELLTARRPTVTTALGSLQRTGRITHTLNGWVLHAPPPGELSELADGSS